METLSVEEFRLALAGKSVEEILALRNNGILKPPARSKAKASDATSKELSPNSVEGIISGAKNSGKQAESQLQSNCVAWFRLQYPQFASLLFSVPNGGSRAWKVNEKGQRYSPEANRMKKEGTLPGVPDLFLAVPTDDKCGMFIEMKVHPNKPSEAQELIMEQLRMHLYEVVVCYTEDEFILAIQNYLKS